MISHAGAFLCGSYLTGFCFAWSLFSAQYEFSEGTKWEKRVAIALNCIIWPLLVMVEWAQILYDGIKFRRTK